MNSIFNPVNSPFPSPAPTAQNQRITPAQVINLIRQSGKSPEQMVNAMLQSGMMSQQEFEQYRAIANRQLGTNF